MAYTLTTISDAITYVAKIFLGIMIAAIVAVTVAAVWWRYVLNAPLSWTEQVSRIFFVWVTFVGAAVLFRERLHVAIDMFVLMMPKQVRFFVLWAVEAILLVFNVIFLIYGLKLSLDTLGQTFGALDISPATFYFAAPVSAAMMILFFFEHLLVPSRRRATDSIGVSTSV
jgi:TRAP-type C4-dicarboxylate transport system permease small subunit